jgi:hypothetical protein
MINFEVKHYTMPLSNWTIHSIEYLTKLSYLSIGLDSYQEFLKSLLYCFSNRSGQ